MLKYLGMAVLGICLFAAPVNAGPFFRFHIDLGFNNRVANYYVDYFTNGQRTIVFRSAYEARVFCYQMRCLNVKTYSTDPFNPYVVYYYCTRNRKSFYNYTEAYRFMRAMRAYRFEVRFRGYIPPWIPN